MSKSFKTKVIRVSTTDSTNRLVKSYELETDTMTVVVADSQTAGRGCGSNKWESEPGKNLTCSIRYAPACMEARRQFIVSMQISVAIVRAMRDFGISATIKWPNDIYWNDKKLAGILIENQLQGNVIKDCIIGIGLNINQNQFLSDAPNPISMFQILGRQIVIGEVLKSIMTHFSAIEDDVYEKYCHALYRSGGVFQYKDCKGLFLASIEKVAEDGLITLCDTEGNNRTYAFKEVVFVI